MAWLKRLRPWFQLQSPATSHDHGVIRTSWRRPKRRWHPWRCGNDPTVASASVNRLTSGDPESLAITATTGTIGSGDRPCPNQHG